MLRFLNAHRVLVPGAVAAISLLLGIACGVANDPGGAAEPSVPAAGPATAAASPTPFSSSSALSAISSGADAGAARLGAADRGMPAAGCSDVSYDSSGDPVSAYLCLPDGAGPWPAVIVLHGAEGPRLNPGYRLIAQGLSGAGFAALQIDYFSQTPGNGPFGNPAAADYVRDAPVWLREIADGVSYLQSLAQIDPRRIGLNGYSLGAFMALDAAMLDPRLKAVVEFYGGVVPGYTENLERMPPVLILHGDADSLVPVSYAYALYDLLSAHGRPVELQIYPGAQHGFNFMPRPAAAPARDDAYARLGAFFAQWLRDGDR